MGFLRLQIAEAHGKLQPLTLRGIRSPKSEFRNNLEMTENSKSNLRLTVKFSTFAWSEGVADFGFRISDFPPDA
jgi:hypothetical protein